MSVEMVGGDPRGRWRWEPLLPFVQVEERRPCRPPTASVAAFTTSREASTTAVGSRIGGRPTLGRASRACLRESLLDEGGVGRGPLPGAARFFARPWPVPTMTTSAERRPATALELRATAGGDDELPLLRPSPRARPRPDRSAHGPRAARGPRPCRSCEGGET